MSDAVDAHRYIELIVSEEEVIAVLLQIFDADEIEYRAESEQVIFRKAVDRLPFVAKGDRS